MISTLIFDFGDVFINLNKQGAMQNALQLFGLKEFDEEILEINKQFEIGLLNEQEFVEYYTSRFSHCSVKDIIDAWNFIIRDFPEHRLKFLQALHNQRSYQLILLSNTNSLHIAYIKKKVPFYNDFQNLFQQFYLSHEIGLRKPNTSIFEFVISENALNPGNCLFIDDTTENTQTARTMGFHVWNLDETSEDVTDLFKINQHLL